jgi:integrase
MASVAERSTKLTKRIVDAAVPRERRYDLWDSDLKGFGLRIETSGRKTFFVRYRAEGGGRNAPRRFMAIGRMGVLTPEQAREKARRILGEVAMGHDPARARSARRDEMLISGLIDHYEKEGCVIQRGKRRGTPMKSITKQFTLARLRHHVVPILGRRRISDVRQSDIVRLVGDITAGKTAKDEKVGPRKRVIVRGGEGAARKVVRDLSAVFTFAKSVDLATSNPCDSAAVNKTDNARTNFLTLVDVMALGRALEELGREGANPKALNIARLWALTGCRRNEIAGLRWDEIDFETGCMRLSDTKTGRSIRPLGGPALQLLASIERNPNSQYVFPAERGGGFYQGTKRVWPEAMRKAGLVGATPHTLRHTLGSTAVSTGETLVMAGALLGHTNMRSTALYAHMQADPSIRAADRVSTKVAAALDGRGSGTAVPIPADQ